LPVGGCGFEPISSTCAPFDSCAPAGFSRVSVSSVIAGSALPSDSSIGACSGAAFRTEAASAPCQSSLVDQRDDARPRGRARRREDGGDRAGDVGDGVRRRFTRVVFFVAMLGKPSCAAESFASDLTPLAGVPGLLGAWGEVPDEGSGSPSMSCRSGSSRPIRVRPPERPMSRAGAPGARVSGQT